VEVGVRVSDGEAVGVIVFGAGVTYAVTVIVAVGVGPDKMVMIGDTNHPRQTQLPRSKNRKTVWKTGATARNLLNCFSFAFPL
jgi:hypothetical protein